MASPSTEERRQRLQRGAKDATLARKYAKNYKSNKSASSTALLSLVPLSSSKSLSEGDHACHEKFVTSNAIEHSQLSSASQSLTRLRKRKRSNHESLLSSQSTSSSSPTSSSSKKLPKQRVVSKWQCQACTLLNSNRRRKCEVCRIPRPIITSSSSSTRTRNVFSTTATTTTTTVMSPISDTKNSPCPKISAWIQQRQDLRRRKRKEQSNDEELQIMTSSNNHFIVAVRLLVNNVCLGESLSAIIITPSAEKVEDVNDIETPIENETETSNSSASSINQERSIYFYQDNLKRKTVVMSPSTSTKEGHIHVFKKLRLDEKDEKDEKDENQQLKDIHESNSSMGENHINIEKSRNNNIEISKQESELDYLASQEIPFQMVGIDSSHRKNDLKVAPCDEDIVNTSLEAANKLLCHSSTQVEVSSVTYQDDGSKSLSQNESQQLCESAIIMTQMEDTCSTSTKKDFVKFSSNMNDMSRSIEITVNAKCNNKRDEMVNSKSVDNQRLIVKEEMMQIFACEEEGNGIKHIPNYNASYTMINVDESNLEQQSLECILDKFTQSIPEDYDFYSRENITESADFNTHENQSKSQPTPQPIPQPTPQPTTQSTPRSKSQSKSQSKSHSKSQSKSQSKENTIKDKDITMTFQDETCESRTLQMSNYNGSLGVDNQNNCQNSTSIIRKHKDDNQKSISRCSYNESTSKASNDRASVPDINDQQDYKKNRYHNSPPRLYKERKISIITKKTVQDNYIETSNNDASNPSSKKTYVTETNLSQLHNIHREIYLSNNKTIQKHYHSLHDKFGKTNSSLVLTEQKQNMTQAQQQQKSERLQAHQSNVSVSFATAGSNKPIVVAEESMVKAQRLFGTGGSQGQSTNASVSFATAGSNKPIVVVEELGFSNDQDIVSYSSTYSISTSITPKHTPFQRRSGLVTRSTGVKNPYNRRLLLPLDKKGIVPLSPDTSIFHQEHGKSTPFLDIKGHSDISTLAGGRRYVNSIDSSNSVPKILNYELSGHVIRNGSLINQKYNMIPLRKFVVFNEPMQSNRRGSFELGTKPLILDITAENSGRVRFDSSGLPSCFSGQSKDIDQSFGDTRTLRHFLVQLGCDNEILQDMWLSNHYRWIVWKLASIERRFPKSFKGLYLIRDRVIDQLKYRYNVEISQAKRPILRKILNRDMASSKMMILIVSNIVVGKGEKSCQGKIELTDGWYCIPAIVDHLLLTFIKCGHIKIGSKLLLCNALLEGADEGIDPLDRNYMGAVRSFSVRLKLFANSTRLCKMDAKLGLVRPTKSIISHGGLLGVKSLSDVLPNGGSIPSIKLVICKSYPILFKEHMSCQSSPKEHIVLTVAQNNIRQKKFEDRQQRFIENEIEDTKKEAIQEVEDDAPNVWKEMNAAVSPEIFYSKLSSLEQNEINKWQSRRNGIINETIQKNVKNAIQSNTGMQRKSTRFVRLYVRALSDKKNQNSQKRKRQNEAELIIWDPTENQMDMLKEGAVFQFHNLGVASLNSYGLLQLAANKNTHFECIAHTVGDACKLVGFPQQRFHSILRLNIMSKKLDRNNLKYPEVDCIGFIVDAVSNTSKEVILLTDGSGLLLRIDHDNDIPDNPIFNDLKRLQGCNTQKRELYIRNVRLLPFDYTQGCAVGIWTSSTYFDRDDRHEDLPPPTEERCKMLYYLYKAKIPVQFKMPQSFSIAFGYVVKSLYQKISNGIISDDEKLSPFSFSFDSLGNGSTFEIVIPHHMLHTFLQRTIQGDCTFSGNLNMDDMITLEEKIIESSTLLRVMLQETQVGQRRFHMLMEVEEADVSSLTQTYLLKDTILAQRKRKPKVMNS